MLKSDVVTSRPMVMQAVGASSAVLTPTPSATPALPASASGTASGTAAPPSALRGLIMQKERELHDINEYRIQSLESLLGDKDREANESKQRMAKLKEDFTYNLRLLEERDAELERYDASFTHMKAVLRDRDVEISDLKIANAELKQSAKQERDRAAEGESYYQQKFASLREESEAQRWKSEEELRAQREELDAQKREQQRAQRAATDAKERELHDAASAADTAKREREREHAVKLEEMEAQLRAASGRAHRAEAALAEAKSRLVGNEEKGEALQSTIRSLERAADEAERAAAGRESRLSSLVEEVERDKTAVERSKTLLAEEHAAQVDELKRALAAAERATALAREQMESVGHTAAAELRESQARAESRLGESRSKVLALEEELGAARQRGAEARREAEEVARLAEQKLAMEREGHSEAMQEACAAMAADKAEAEGRLADAEMRASQAEEAILSTRREVSAARGELSATHDALSDSRRQVTALRNELADMEQRAELGKAERHEEMILALQSQRDAAATSVREMHRALAEAEAKCEALKAERTQAEASRISAEARAHESRVELESTRDELHTLQAHLAALQSGRADGTHGNGTSVEHDDLDSALPSPVSIPSLPVSPYVGMAGRGGARGFGGTTATLDAENARLRHRVSTMEEAATKTRQVINEMTAEVERLRGGAAGQPKLHGAESEVANLENERTHLLAYTELLQSRCEELSKGAPAAADVNAAEVRMLRARVKALDETAAHLRVSLRDTQSDKQRAEQQASDLRAELAQARLQIAELAKLSHATAALAERTQECEALRLRSDGGGMVHSLQAKLTAAEADVARLTAEREKLMEISNMLRADLNRCLADGGPLGPTSVAASDRAEREVAARYEAKLTDIEGAMRELVMQNRTLKVELRKWTLGGGADEDAAIGSSAAGGGVSEVLTAAAHDTPLSASCASASAAGRASAHMSIGGPGSRIRERMPVDRLGAAEVGILRGSSLLGGDGAADAERGRSLLAADDAIAHVVPPRTPACAWGEKGEGGVAAAGADDGDGGLLYCCPGDGTATERSEAVPTGGGGDHRGGRLDASAERALRRATMRRADSTGDEADGPRARARAKLDEARLQLSGSAAPQHSRAERPGFAAAASERATPSQVASASQAKAKLQNIQAKRSELIRKRQLIRNYNSLREDEAPTGGA